MKKNRTMRVAALLLALTLITSCFVGGTMAKYTATATASSTATVAKWSFEVGEDNDITAQNPQISFDLFNTVKDSNGTSDETDVSSGKIAPGTSGSFALVIENTSEVTAEFDIAFTETVTNGVTDVDLPIKYSLAGGGNWVDSIAELNITNEKLTVGSAAVTKTIQWKWDFNTNDTNDTKIGVAAKNTNAVPSVQVTATITVDQVD